MNRLLSLRVFSLRVENREPSLLQLIVRPCDRRKIGASNHKLRNVNYIFNYIDTSYDKLLDNMGLDIFLVSKDKGKTKFFIAGLVERFLQPSVWA